ncbi:hypothetical protein Taro_022890 [Colocasia esculenta]|uniref:Acyl-[acyl-carrier-protein] hydrolase n=1 Tax=Colocasia esculenta TaxID=4460 RepID=A0A843V4Z2_COLES|nr:hypothetical protein [Colocasia esculenta]
MPCAGLLLEVCLLRLTTRSAWLGGRACEECRIGLYWGMMGPTGLGPPAVLPAPPPPPLPPVAPSPRGLHHLAADLGRASAAAAAALAVVVEAEKRGGDGEDDREGEDETVVQSPHPPQDSSPRPALLEQPRTVPRPPSPLRLHRRRGRRLHGGLRGASRLLPGIFFPASASAKASMGPRGGPGSSGPDIIVDAFRFDRAVFRQSFSIWSYEIDADRTASIETLMNHLQVGEMNEGLTGEGFGSTPEMSGRNLIWVVTICWLLWNTILSVKSTKTLIVRGDVVDVETWVDASGKNGMHRDWHVRDRKTGQTITRGQNSLMDIVWLMMNKQTRRLSKIPEEVRAEKGHYFIKRSAILDEGSRKLPKLDDDNADCVHKGLTLQKRSLDLNGNLVNESSSSYIVVLQYSSIVLFNFANHEVDEYLKNVEKHASSLLPEMRKDGDL